MAIYYFTVQLMSPHPQVARRYSVPRGSWLPPKAFGYNLRRGPQMAFRHDGETTTPIRDLPDGVTAYRTYSLYYCSGLLLTVPYDATAVQVHDGDEAVTRNDDDDDDEDGDDEEEYQPDWAELKFGALRGDTSYLSYAQPGLESLTLRVQRNNQRWAHYFLPDRYHAVPRMNHQNHGGLVGELPLLLALVAMSMPATILAQALPLLVANPWQLPPQIETSVPRSSQWQTGKGLVVTVYYDQNETSAHELRNYERGVYGPIFP